LLIGPWSNVPIHKLGVIVGKYYSWGLSPFKNCESLSICDTKADILYLAGTIQKIINVDKVDILLVDYEEEPVLTFEDYSLGRFLLKLKLIAWNNPIRGTIFLARNEVIAPPLLLDLEVMNVLIVLRENEDISALHDLDVLNSYLSLQYSQFCDPQL
jgi:hypothetical protein